jgi:pimeloyl-ACP methyl ester carboxylesterase
VISQLDAAAVHQAVAFDTGRSVRWRHFGKGPALVLLHGGHGSWLHWIRNIEALRARHSLWIPDLPGYGDSNGLVKDEGLERMVAIVIASLDALVGRGTGIDLCGFSFGGVVASRVAAQRGHVRRLALIGSAGHGTPRRSRGEMRPWRALDPEARLEALRYNLGLHMIHDASKIDADALEAYVGPVMTTRFRSKSISRAASLASLLEPLEQPVLLLWGEHDVTSTPELAAKALTEGHPQREAHVIPGGGHWVQFECADEVNRRLSAWFAHAA